MSSVLFFQNIKKPITGSGIPKFPHDRGVAFHNTDTFFASPIGSTGNVYWEMYPKVSFATLKAWVQMTFGDLQPQESDYVPGTVYKRINWPLVSGSFYRAIDQDKKAQSFVALRILLEKLAAIFQVIEPSKKTQITYGHLVRELLLLACMEVESSWTAVLRENGYRKTSLTTSDYVRLNEAMLLDSYQLSLRSYPDFPAFSPFVDWDEAAPTKSLPWYEAYNKTKHDRESNLECGSLVNAVHAVGAAVVMFYAQFGFHVEPALGEQPVLFIRNTFSLATDFEKHRNACYIPELAVQLNSSPTPTPSIDWKLVDYPF